MRRVIARRIHEVAGWRRRGTWAGAPTGIAGATMAALAGKYVIVLPYTPIEFSRGRHFAA